MLSYGQSVSQTLLVYYHFCHHQKNYVNQFNPDYLSLYQKNSICLLYISFPFKFRNLCILSYYLFKRNATILSKYVFTFWLYSETLLWNTIDLSFLPKYQQSAIHQCNYCLLISEIFLQKTVILYMFTAILEISLFEIIHVYPIS